MSDAKRKVGRPHTPGRVGQYATLATRVTGRLKARLLREVTANKRSLSHEIEMRLERSFERDNLDTRIARIEAALARIESRIGHAA